MKTLTPGAAWFCLLLAAPVLGRTDTLPGAFLRYGGAPRSQALGKAFTAIADDQQAGFYNPGGLFQVNTVEVIAAYSQLRDGQMAYVGHVIPTRELGSFALSFLHHAEDPDSGAPENGGSGAKDNAFMASYCYSPRYRVGFGATARLVTRNTDRQSDLGFGIDAGVLVRDIGPFSFGLSAQNLLQPAMQLDTDYVYPRTMRAGLGIRLLDRILVAADVSSPLFVEDRPAVEFTPHAGLEFHIVPRTLVQRIGYDPDELSLGLGYHRHLGSVGLGADYALLLDHGSGGKLSPTHKVGLLASFGGFRTRISARPKVFNPTSQQARNILWMDISHNSRAPARHWRVLIKNSYGKVVRTFSGRNAPPSQLAWDGLDDAGRLAFDGSYNYEIVIVDESNSRLSFSGSLTRVKTRGPEGRFETRLGGGL